MPLQQLSILLLSLIIACSGIVINLLKRGQKAEIILTKDGSTLLLFRLFIPLALIGSLVFYFMEWGHIEMASFWIYFGGILVVAGLLTRWVAVWSLGSAFTVKVTIQKDQQLKTNGFYTYLRHPSYTGLLMYYFGLGLMMQNGWSLLILMLGSWAAVLYRIPLEEKVLEGHFGEVYKAFKAKTWRLIPFVY